MLLYFSPTSQDIHPMKERRQKKEDKKKKKISAKVIGMGVKFYDLPWDILPF